MREYQRRAVRPADQPQLAGPFDDAERLQQGIDGLDVS
jgi:hypothetical protein